MNITGSIVEESPNAHSEHSDYEEFENQQLKNASANQFESNDNWFEFFVTESCEEGGQHE